MRRPGFDIDDPKSTAHLMPAPVLRNEKPIVGIVDGGQLYDSMCVALMDRGVGVFRARVHGTRVELDHVGAALMGM